MRRLLIVDDERNVHYSFRRALAGEFEVQSAHDGEEALESLQREAPDVILLDVKLPRLGGLETLEQIRATHPRVPVIVMTAFGTVETAIRATALSAREYLLKPVDVPALKRLLSEVLPHASLPDEPPAAPPSDVGIIGRSPRMQELFKLIGRAAASDSTVLITGESGTGKELVARAVHYHSRRKSGPLVAINCAAIPSNLLESELFGHERGAFTGAEAPRPGKFEVAHRGTLLLDEIGEMEPALQAKCLRVLQSREVTRLGAAAPRTFDVRVVAMTNADLEARVAGGAFREDLYYRLNVLRLQVPPLRERDGDVWLLANHFLDSERARLGRPLSGFDPACQAALAAHHWPGNVRELENVVAQACLRARGDRIRREDLVLRTPDSPAGVAAGDPTATMEVALERFFAAHPGESFERLERMMVMKALAMTGGNQVRAARLLGITRNVLRKRMARYEL